MKWLDGLLGRTTPDSAGSERDKDRRALRELHRAFDQVQGRTERLQRELRRINSQLRERQVQ